MSATQDHAPVPAPAHRHAANRLNRRRLLGAGAGMAVPMLLGSGILIGPPRAAAQGLGQQPVTPEAIGPTIPPEFIDFANDWPTPQGNLAGTRAARGSSIASNTVDQLGVVWHHPITAQGAWGALVANPIVTGDTVYIQDMLSNVYALDRASGELLWQVDYNIGTNGPNGVAIGYGRLIVPLGDTAEVIALDPGSGAECWRTRLSNTGHEGVDLGPLVYDNTVIVSTVPGNSVEFYRGGQKGTVSALEIATGRVIWQWDSTTDNLWGNVRANSGGGIWYPPSVDDDGVLYMGIGNAGPWPGTAAFPSGSSRPGDNLYASSMVAFDPAAGAVLWHINAKPHDLFDHDFQNTPILTTIMIDGEETLIAIGSGKTGTVIAANAKTGDELWRTAVGKHHNDELQEIPTGEEIEVFPGVGGGIQTPIAYADGKVYVPTHNWSHTLSGTMVAGGMPINEATAELLALDVATGDVVWSVAVPTLLTGSATVANDLVFTGGLDGLIRAFSTGDGTLVWSYQAPAGINAPFAIAGDYLFVPAGGPLIHPPGVDNPVTAPAPGLIAFKLSGDLASPAPAGPEMMATPSA